MQPSVLVKLSVLLISPGPVTGWAEQINLLAAREGHALSYWREWTRVSEDITDGVEPALGEGQPAGGCWSPSAPTEEGMRSGFRRHGLGFLMPQG